MKPPKTQRRNLLRGLAKLLERLGLRPKEKKQDPISIAVEAVNLIKKFVESGTATWMVIIIDALIPGDQKEQIAKVRKAIAKALLLVGLATEKAKTIEMVAQNEQLNEALLLLRTINKKDRGQLYSQIAGHVASELTNEVFESAKEMTDKHYRGTA